MHYLLFVVPATEGDHDHFFAVSAEDYENDRQYMRCVGYLPCYGAIAPGYTDSAAMRGGTLTPAHDLAVRGIREDSCICTFLDAAPVMLAQVPEEVPGYAFGKRG